MSFSVICGMLSAMSTELPFPTPDPARERPRHDFPPFPAGAGEPATARALELMTVGGVTAVWFRCRPGWTLPARTVHDDMFLYVVRGTLDIVIAGRAAVVPRGACAHFRRGVVHAAAARPGQRTEIISLHYTATLYQSVTLPVLLEFPDVFPRGGPATETLLEDACRLYRHRPAGYRRALEAVATRLLVDTVHARAPRHRPPADAWPTHALRRMLPALEAMHADLAAPVSVQALARRCGLSESQFRRVFRRTFGELPVQCQRRLRMEHACRLLRETDLTVAAVAAAVGYAEPAFFAHSFRRLIGLPPGRYRARHEL